MHRISSPIRLNGCQPRTLDSLMGLYSSNYRKLLRLAPELDLLQDHSVSRVSGALDLHLLIVERFKYTTELSLSYAFEGRDEPLLEPDIRMRIYHDARLVEVLGHARRQRHEPDRRCVRGRVPAVEQRWEVNRFLQRWLGYCQRQGHLFLRATNAVALTNGMLAASES